MQQSVEDRRGDDGIAEDVAPTGQTLVGCENDRAALVATGDELKQRNGLGGFALDFRFIRARYQP